MKSQINQVTLDYNGNIVLSGYVNGHKVQWTISQKKMLELLKTIKSQ